MSDGNMDCDEEYIHYQECLTSLNTAWSILCELEHSDESTILRSAAYKMALIEYWKPYGRSDGQFQSHKLSKPTLSETESKLHEKIKRLRNTVLAHSDINVQEAKVYLSESNGKQLPLIISNKETQWPTPTEIRRLIETILDQLYQEQIEFEKRYTGKS